MVTLVQLNLFGKFFNYVAGGSTLRHGHGRRNASSRPRAQNDDRALSEVSW